MKKKLIRLVSYIVCISLSVGAFSALSDEISDIQDKIDDYNQQIEDNQKEIENLDAELADLALEEADKRAYQETLQEKIVVSQDNLVKLQQSIDLLDENILSLTKSIEQAELQYQYTLEVLKERVVAIYTSGTVSNLEILLNAENLQDYSMRALALETVAQHDRKLMEELVTFSESTKEDKLLLEEQKLKVGELKADKEVEILNLENLSKQNIALINEINAEQEDKENEISLLVQEEEGFEEEIKALIEEQERLEEEARQEAANNGGLPSTGATTDSTNGATEGSGDGSAMSEGYDPVWPVPGFSDSYWFTCPFGNGHNGFDIAAYEGTPVVATQSGKVLSAYYAWDWGNNVLIYHNSTYSTRSAHLITMAVSAGEYVERGQVIGYVGNTGRSFGNHLHFEVYKNGVRVDPWPYIGG